MGENGESTTGENVDGDNSDCLFDLLFKSQALRMNDQRCALDEIASSSSTNRGNVDRNTNSSVAGGDSLVGEDDSFFDLLIGLQVSCFSLSLSLRVCIFGHFWQSYFSINLVSTPCSGATPQQFMSFRWNEVGLISICFFVLCDAYSLEAGHLNNIFCIPVSHFIGVSNRFGTVGRISRVHLCQSTTR